LGKDDVESHGRIYMGRYRSDLLHGDLPTITVVDPFVLCVYRRGNRLHCAEGPEELHLWALESANCFDRLYASRSRNRWLKTFYLRRTLRPLKKDSLGPCSENKVTVVVPAQVWRNSPSIRFPVCYSSRHTVYLYTWMEDVGYDMIHVVMFPVADSRIISTRGRTRCEVSDTILT